VLKEQGELCEGIEQGEKISEDDINALKETAKKAVS
jgi:hypothetical protein